MSNEYEETVRERNKAKSRLDYFILSITLAFLSYSVYTFRPLPIDELLWLVPCSWVGLLLSFFMGLYRAQVFVDILSFESGKQAAESILDVLIASGKTNIQKKVELLKTTIEVGGKLIEQSKKRHIAVYRIQLWLLICSILIFAWFKIINISII